jgi:hypothetical protein
LIFSGLARFFSGVGSIRYFRFQAYKTETKPAGFFKILIDFFLLFSFFGFFAYPYGTLVHGEY